MVVYLPHSGYWLNYFQETLMDIESFAMDAWDKRYTLIIAGDFNLILDHGDRGRAMTEFCTQFYMDIANGQTPADDVDTWIWKFRSYLQRIDYILYSKSIRSDDITSNLIRIWSRIIGTCRHLWKSFDRQSLEYVAGHHLKDGNLHWTRLAKLINVMKLWIRWWRMRIATLRGAI